MIHALDKLFELLLLFGQGTLLVFGRVINRRLIPPDRSNNADDRLRRQRKSDFVQQDGVRLFLAIKEDDEAVRSPDFDGAIIDFNDPVVGWQYFDAR